MIAPAECFLQFGPTGEFFKASIESLTPEIVETAITQSWWNDEALKNHFEHQPIDRDWDWQEMEIEHGGKVLESELVGVITADGYVQGAMLIARAGVESMLEDHEKAIFVELLFTAPRNRTILRKDGCKFFGAVGLELLRWAARLSQKMGFQGRLRLDGSPDYVKWYERLGFKCIPIEPVVYEGVKYLPMELPVTETVKLLSREGA